MANSRQDQMLREYEKVLDSHHKSLTLWSRDRPSAIFAALAQFDCSAIYSLFLPPHMSVIGPSQLIKGVEEGFSQGIRWLHPGTPLDVVADTDKDLIGEAGNYCAFATKYVDVADFHKMYGRGLVDLEVDEAVRRVKFIPKPGRSPAALFPLAEQVHRSGRVQRKLETLDDLRQPLLVALRSARVSYVQGRVALDDLAVVNSDAVRQLLTEALPTEPLPLDPDVDLLGFTVEDFTQYSDALRRWSFCCTLLFLLSLHERRKQQWECIPTQVLARAEFLRSMSELSGLDDRIIQVITERLTFDHRTAWPEVFQQPLLCGPTTVAWSVQLAQSSRSMRNMLKLMSRTPALQKHAATLIGSREGSMLRELGTLFSREGRSAYKLGTRIVASDGSEGEIDLLAYNAKFPDEVLVVEGKAVLAVDEVNEVNSATEEMKHGQEQLATAIQTLADMPEREKASLFKFVKWPMVKNVYGVVVAADADPNESYDHNRFPGISLQTIQARLRSNHLASPQKFWNACKDRKWLDNLRKYDRSYKTVQVGDVSYELPIVTGPSELDNIRRQASK
jgi:hypothetical protein